MTVRDGFRLEPLSVRELADWSALVRRRFVEHRVVSGSIPASDAGPRVDGILAGLLPDGTDTPDHHFLRAWHGSTDVGRLWVRVRPDTGEAFLFDVALEPGIDPAVTGQQLIGAVESWAGELGATELRVNVFCHDLPTVSAIDGRGFRLAVTQMIRQLDGSPDGDAAAGPVALRAMTRAEYEVFRAGQEAAYADELARSGTVPAAEARQRADSEMAELLPEGWETPDQLLYTGYAGGVPVGYLWLQEETDSAGLHAFVCDITVYEQLRRRGHGRAMMRAAERICRQRGAVAVRLAVFGFNHGARALYDQLGYRATEELRYKPL